MATHNNHPKKRERMSVVGCRVPAFVKAALQAEAARTDRDESYVARRILTAHVRRHAKKSL